MRASARTSGPQKGKSASAPEGSLPISTGLIHCLRQVLQQRLNPVPGHRLHIAQHPPVGQGGDHAQHQKCRRGQPQVAEVICAIENRRPKARHHRLHQQAHQGIRARALRPAQL
ncbi:hypothetical protein ACP_1633 [Acidobacterium capsulatum ATCC 51196]|uniref:Uncharacterized protein n=1 Tax=Acidobacterium capsulatum (strain ATCC 51196 / DSM 11244 / BCRC 80197 / JCM 7670 / NBRC 15755 / NCIMB 13165 / 161) TaxID=240015 RepID=C1F778_ACIC5|nr:hypothetical protein ACP_1633 [Acidobacterium capsulatum ATCC 51196]